MLVRGEGCCHIHIGPGKAGLGLLAAASTEAGIETHLVASRDSELRDGTRFELRVLGLAGRNVYRELSIGSLSRAGRFDELEPACQQALLHAPSLLLSTAVTTKNLPACKDFLVDLALRRRDSSDARGTVFIAGENDPGAAYPELVGALAHAGVDCRRTVVNRFCTDARDDNERGSRVVSVDELAEWIVEGAARSHAVLAGLEHVEFVTFAADITPFELRKRWLINGAHLALAIIAHRHPIPSIDTAMAMDGLPEWTMALERTLIESLEHTHPQLEGSLEYAMAHMPVWLRHSDPVTRILSRLRRQDPLNFLIDFERKFASAIRAHPRPAARMTPQVTRVFNDLQITLERANLYVDHRSLPQVMRSVPNASDMAALIRYRELLRGFFPPEEVERRALRLALSYAKHRDIYQ